ncbi:MAG TPA: hypothetical protein DFR83_02400, partial [Deltaproteobacteria bacterium]|nr:hypothetical protein [Deltaproteobacteria bacterium]
TDDTDDTDEPGPPPKGDVVVEYTVSWDFGDTIIEVCSSTLALTDVDTSHRTWTVWTDAGIDLDPHDLPNTAPESTPVGDGTTFNPGSHRFSVNQTTDPDLASYEAALVSGATPICLLASGNDLSLEQAVIPEPIPELVGALTEVGLRISVAWTDR